VSGVIAIWALLGYVRRRTYLPFVVYRILMAALVVLVIAAGWREPTF
jgi:undecaprenyl pyrophosphate phosphatase UppP